jgi:ketosteroid isomerase-like protein
VSTSMDTERVRECALNFVKQTMTAHYAVELFAPGFVCETPVSGTMTLDRFLEAAAKLVARFPTGYFIEARATVVEGDRAVVTARSHGVLHNGRVYENDYVYLLEFVNDRIKHVKVYYDTHVAYALLGYPVRD